MTKTLPLFLPNYELHYKKIHQKLHQKIRHATPSQLYSTAQHSTVSE